MNVLFSSYVTVQTYLLCNQLCNLLIRLPRCGHGIRQRGLT